jgi:hypothetical protein
LSDEDEIFAGFDSREHSRLIALLQRAVNEAGTLVLVPEDRAYPPGKVAATQQNGA